jgi:hypothetical protein
MWSAVKYVPSKAVIRAVTDSNFILVEVSILIIFQNTEQQSIEDKDHKWIILLVKTSDYDWLGKIPRSCLVQTEITLTGLSKVSPSYGNKGNQ